MMMDDITVEDTTTGIISTDNDVTRCYGHVKSAQVT